MNDTLTIRIVGLESILSKFGEMATKSVPDAITNGLLKSADYVLTQLKSNTPVDTGNLRESEYIDTTAIQNNQVVIGPNIEMARYAPFVEYGHHTRSGSWVPGQFFVMRTAVETQPQISEIFARELSNKLS